MSDSFITDEAETRLAHMAEGGHWLLFDGDRRVLGCQCGFPASPDDHGFGDSVLDHFQSSVEAQLRNTIADEIGARFDALQYPEPANPDHAAGFDAGMTVAYRIARGVL